MLSVDLLAACGRHGGVRDQACDSVTFSGNPGQ